MTQEQHIYNWLNQGRTLTPLQALNKWGCMRLGARIWNLKQKGMKISRKMITVKTRNGEAVVAQYRRV